MRKLAILLLCILSMQGMAQEEKLRVTFNVGDPIKINVNDIKDVTFVEDNNPLDIEGEWFNEEVEKLGAYETFEFRDDGTLTYCPYYVDYHSGYTIPGTYNFEDYMLTMQLSLVGILTQSITGHTPTSYTVTSGGSNSIYYKVQKTYNLKSNDSPITIGNDGDNIIFVDNEFITLENNMIKPVKVGTGYALVMDSKLETTVAYKVVVEYAPCEVSDWTQYFEKSKEEIIAQFGTPDIDQLDDDKDFITFISPKDFSYLSMLSFSIDKQTGKAFQVQAVFNLFDDLKTYYSEIRNKYIYQSDISSNTELYFYDSNDVSTRSVRICICTTPVMSITYTSSNR